jgi:hypothetical protein
MDDRISSETSREKAGSDQIKLVQLYTTLLGVQIPIHKSHQSLRWGKVDKHDMTEGIHAFWAFQGLNYSLVTDKFVSVLKRTHSETYKKPS